MRQLLSFKLHYNVINNTLSSYEKVSLSLFTSLDITMATVQVEFIEITRTDLILLAC